MVSIMDIFIYDIIKEHTMNRFFFFCVKVKRVWYFCGWEISPIRIVKEIMSLHVEFAVFSIILCCADDVTIFILKP